MSKTKFNFKRDIKDYDYKNDLYDSYNIYSRKPNNKKNNKRKNNDDEMKYEKWQ